jgi:GT2 family glycosyltransferase
LSDSLSVIVPLHNAQSSLGLQVEDCLEVLPELTDQFEVLLVDDGSTDGTEEIAHELANRYPQVRVIRQQQSRGASEAIQVGMECADGGIVFIHDSGQPLSAACLRELWQLRHDQELVAARPQPVRETTWLEQLIQWANQLPAAESRQGGLQMIRRDAVRELMTEAREERAPAEHRQIRPPTLVSGLREFTLGE